jgi:tryptophan 2,3-dioxygenase
MSQDVTYGEYLRLKELLACQQPLTGNTTNSCS